MSGGEGMASSAKQARFSTSRGRAQRGGSECDTARPGCEGRITAGTGCATLLRAIPPPAPILPREVENLACFARRLAVRANP